MMVGIDDISRSTIHRPKPKPAPKAAVNGHAGEERFHGDPGPGGQDDVRPPAARFPLVWAGDLALNREEPCMLAGMLPLTGITLLWGPPKCGKSFLSIDMMMAVARQVPYRGRLVSGGGPVVYCALEGAKAFEKRILAYNADRGVTATTKADLPFYIQSTTLDLIKENATLGDAIAAQIGPLKPSAITIDTVNRSLVGSENSDEDMGAYVAASDYLSRRFDCLVLLVHHCGHDAERPRGHSLLLGAVDAQISVKKDPETSIFRASLDFAKDFSAVADLVSKLRVVELGTTPGGTPITSCVVDTIAAEEAPEPAVKGRPKMVGGWPLRLKMLKDCIGRTMDGHGQLHTPEAGWAEVKAIPQDLVRTEFYKSHPGEKQDTRRKAFVRDVKAALEYNLIACREKDDLSWLWFL